MKMVYHYVAFTLFKRAKRSFRRTAVVGRLFVALSGKLRVDADTARPFLICVGNYNVSFSPWPKLVCKNARPTYLGPITEAPSRCFSGP